MLSGLSILQAVRSGYVPEPKLKRLALLDGRSVWQAACSLPHGVFQPGGLYCNVAVGASSCKIVAVRKAVMEAIERLAYVAVRQSQDRNAHGFGICYDTSGMAAAPRLSPGAASRARAHAQMEAFERRAIDHWWQGRLPAKRLPSIGPVDALTIIVPQKPNSQDQRAVVIAWAHTPAGRAYGFAAGSTLATAFEQAITELSRNHCALSEFRSYQDVRLSLQEKRLLHFAGDAGTRLFDERAVASFGLAAEKGERGPLRLVVDEPIQGPWSKYAVVWRCLYEGTSWMSSKEPNAFAF